MEPWKSALTTLVITSGNLKAERIVLRTMFGKATLHTLFLAWLLAGGQSAMAQTDTTSLGGPESNESYLGEGEGALADDATFSDVWSEEDSIARIPAYLAYRDWDTDDIFKRSDIKDTVDLELSRSEHDHYMPVCGRITSPFGPRHGHNHYGTDLKVEVGDPVYCAFPGMVRISRYHKDFGNVVVVRHTNGLETLYGHMSKRLVEVGDVVQAGTELGLGGSTGRSTGSHLHFETRYRGVPIDPLTVFDHETGTLLATSLVLTPENNRRPVPLASSSAASHKVWKVRSGDTLYGISKRTGVPVNSLRKMNGMGSRSALRVGQRLRYH